MFSIGMPHIRTMQGYRDHNFRIFYFCYTGDRLVLLHGIRKTSDKTPENDLTTALERMNNYLEGCE